MGTRHSEVTGSAMSRLGSHRVCIYIVYPVVLRQGLARRSFAPPAPPREKSELVMKKGVAIRSKWCINPLDNRAGRKIVSALLTTRGHDQAKASSLVVAPFSFQ